MNHIRVGVLDHGPKVAHWLQDAGKDLMETGKGAWNNHQRRDLDDDDLFDRDLDAEKLFGREYDPLDERDDIGDLFVRDLAAEELYEREYDHLDERDTVDNQNFFLRGLEAEEFFRR